MQEIEELIVSALEGAGFFNVRGPADIGDVDDVGYPVTLIEASY